ncbi:hypothetical protein [Desertibacillus haloalkaliphilus]|uniref:hypothetical protein n=1 Tax=Desertibacillus haloalkaliphilus TaxID=1328930 RepID=UPI001C260395|nr:hypothetical protein [Desertibacillus haloalkaliphilus]MBU8908513.1 hypothetical protein [Desertibacillus haloalkaliphilus]
MNSSVNPKKIVLVGSNILAAVQREGVAGAGIQPGMLVAYDGNGDLVPHDVAGALTPKYIADMPDYVGGGIDYEYQVGDQVKVQAGIGGTQFYMWLSGGEDVSKGDLLESAGDGTLRGETEGVPLFVALENVSADVESVRIKVEVL